VKNAKIVVEANFNILAQPLSEWTAETQKQPVCWPNFEKTLPSKHSAQRPLSQLQEILSPALAAICSWLVNMRISANGDEGYVFKDPRYNFGQSN